MNMNKTIKAIRLFKILSSALIAITMLLGFSVNAAEEGRMYWVGGGDGDIKRSGLDGSNREIVLDATDTGGALAITLDQINGKMYWMTSRSVRRANLDGSNIEILTTIPSGGIGNFISLDVDSGKMYYGAFGRIRRADTDGTNEELIYDESGIGISNIFGPVLDPQAGKMYWAITQPGMEKILRADLDGTNIEDLITTGLGFVNGIALDVSGGKLYWTSSSTTNKVVSRANLDGTGEEVLVGSLSSVAGVALDIPASKLYFINPQFSTIFQANLDGSDLTSIQTGIGANSLMLALELEIIPPDFITFIYDSTTNASPVGGSSNEPVTVTFTFDSGLSNGTGSFGTSPANGSYGPWEGTLRVGNDTVVLTGGTIEVFNDASTDGYDFRWHSARGTSTGTLFGETLEFFRVLIVDDDLDMLTSINLPSDPSFALKGDFIQDSYDLSNFSSFGLSEFSGPGRSFTLNSIKRVHDANFDFLGTPQDGFNLTRDTKAKLEWLDLSLSTSRSVVDVLPQFSESDDFEGFRHATRSEVDALFFNAGIPDRDSSSSEDNLIPVSNLVKNYLGTTNNDVTDPVFSIQGYVNAQNISGAYSVPFLTVRTDLGWAAASTGGTTNVTSAPSNGHWLVRTTNPVVEFVGTVRTVDDFAGNLGVAVNVGDTITGTYTYDTTKPDTQVVTTVGDYRYTSAPFGIKVNVNGSGFETDPNNVDFIVQIVNDIGASPRDNYLLRSYNNLFDSSVPNPRHQGNHISWQLDDPTATALTSDLLPPVPPVLADFQSNFGLTISSEGDFDSFHIRSDVTSAKLGDGDWISDEIDRTFDGSFFVDQRSFYSDHFSDQQLLSPQGDAGTTFGRILERDGLIVQVTDNPVGTLGVRFEVLGGGNGTAVVELCNFSTPFIMELTKGDAISITCSSVAAEVLAGEVTFNIGDGDIIIDMPTDAVVKVTETAGEDLMVENLPESIEPIMVTFQGQEVSVVPGEEPVGIEIGVITSDVQPMLAAVDTEIDLTAKIELFASGEISIIGAEYNIDGGSYTGMSAQDGVFDAAVEEAIALIPGFSEAGVHDVCVRGIASDTVGDPECVLLAIFDPEGGFVTGGGWIHSPIGAYVYDQALTGKAYFGFVSKYKKGANTPTGQTEFQFQTAGLNFHSNTYDWLVVAGARAQYKGVGTINGSGDYGFMLTAIDGQKLNNSATDKFRMKIWRLDDEQVIYDNQMGEEETSEPTTSIGGGSIVIHKAK